MAGRDNVAPHRGWWQMATGKSAGGYIENGNWQQIEPQSVDQALWDMASAKNHNRHGQMIVAVPVLPLLN